MIKEEFFIQDVKTGKYLVEEDLTGVYSEWNEDVRFAQAFDNKKRALDHIKLIEFWDDMILKIETFVIVKRN